MQTITIAIATDHRGFSLKESLKEVGGLGGYSVSWIDVGAFSEERSDYPEFAIKAVEAMKFGDADCAVLICGTGVGMAIAANRYHGIYAALAWDLTTARLAKEDDHANVLVLPSDYISHELAQDMVTAWLLAEFKKGRYAERIKMIDAIR
ncbi:MAG: RpiB/LacA/LacB family sugar-phosphate isomerase [Candidatus Babeliales bacterium]